MIVDSSAVIAVLLRETDFARFSRAILDAPRRRMSVASFLEAAIVLESRRGTRAGHELDDYLDETGVELVPVTPEQAYAARRAWRQFGKGNHPAGLNFGDCFAYALAESTGEPLLFKGGDFTLTDIEAA